MWKSTKESSVVENRRLCLNSRVEKILKGGDRGWGLGEKKNSIPN